MDESATANNPLDRLFPAVSAAITARMLYGSAMSVWTDQGHIRHIACLVAQNIAPSEGSNNARHTKKRISAVPKETQDLDQADEDTIIPGLYCVRNNSHPIRKRDEYANKLSTYRTACLECRVLQTKKYRHRAKKRQAKGEYNAEHCAKQQVMLVSKGESSAKKRQELRESEAEYRAENPEMAWKKYWADYYLKNGEEIREKRTIYKAKQRATRLSEWEKGKNQQAQRES